MPVNSPQRAASFARRVADDDAMACSIKILGNHYRDYQSFRADEREEAADEEAIAGIRRERDKMRQRNSRLARKYGLKGRRERS